MPASVVPVILVATALAVAPGLAAADAQQKGKKEYRFRGTIEKIDARARTLTVNGENVPGWMAAMSMDYAVDKPDVLKKVKTGDRITARVYEGDFKTLYDVEVVPPDEKPGDRKP